MTTGLETHQFVVPPTPRDDEGDVDLTKETPIALSFQGNEVRKARFESDQDLTVTAIPASDKVVDRPELRVNGNDPFKWQRGEISLFSFGNDRVEHLYVVNFGGSSGSRQSDFNHIVIESGGDGDTRCRRIDRGFSLALFSAADIGSRMSAIALATYKSEIAEPLFPIILRSECSD